jgi:hypothetical protein
MAAVQAVGFRVRVGARAGVCIGIAVRELEDFETPPVSLAVVGRNGIEENNKLNRVPNAI